MIIGIDVRALSKRFTGIAVYIESMLTWFQRLEKENTYILFSNHDFIMDTSWNRCRKVILDTKLPGTFGICYQLKKLIREYGIELFWGPEHSIPFGNIGCKRAVTIHDISVILMPAWGTVYNSVLQRFLVRRSVKYADKVICISHSTEQDVRDYCGIDDGKTCCIYNGDSPFRDNLHDYTRLEVENVFQKYNISGEYFIYFGTIEPRKNIITIVRAFGYYRDHHKSAHTKLVLAGGLGWKYRKILSEVERSPYKKDIIQTGYVTEMEKEVLYQNAICLLFPSLYEGFGLPVLEAMSCGTPVITANNSSLPEVGGDVAYYIEDALDEGALSIQMEKITGLTDEKRKELSDRSIEHARLYSRKKCAEELLKLFLGMCNEEKK